MRILHTPTDTACLWQQFGQPRPTALDLSFILSFLGLPNQMKTLYEHKSPNSISRRIKKVYSLCNVYRKKQLKNLLVYVQTLCHILSDLLTNLNFNEIQKNNKSQWSMRRQQHKYDEKKTAEWRGRGSCSSANCKLRPNAKLEQVSDISLNPWG